MVQPPREVEVCLRSEWEAVTSITDALKEVLEEILVHFYAACSVSLTSCKTHTHDTKGILNLSPFLVGNEKGCMFQLCNLKPTLNWYVKRFLDLPTHLYPCPQGGQ